MKKLVVALFTLAAMSCSILNKETTYKETHTFDTSSYNDITSIEKDMAHQLYMFYSNKKADNYAFYEVLAGALLINYNPNSKTLNYASDLCSGWVAQYKNVDENMLKKLAEAKVPFAEYDTLLQRQATSNDWFPIRSNGCGGQLSTN